MGTNLALNLLVPLPCTLCFLCTQHRCLLCLASSSPPASAAFSTRFFPYQCPHTLTHVYSSLLQGCSFCLVHITSCTKATTEATSLSAMGSNLALCSHNFIESQNPRTAWVAKAHTPHCIPTPCCVQGRQPAAQAAQSHIQPGLECLQGWGIYSLLGQPVQCVTTLWVKNFRLISNLNLLSFLLLIFLLQLLLFQTVEVHCSSAESTTTITLRQRRGQEREQSLLLPRRDVHSTPITYSAIDSL